MRLLSSSSSSTSSSDSCFLTRQLLAVVVELRLNRDELVDRREARSIRAVEEARRASDVEDVVAIEEHRRDGLGRVDVRVRRDLLDLADQYLFVDLRERDVALGLGELRLELGAPRQRRLVAGGGRARRGLGLRDPHSRAVEIVGSVCSGGNGDHQPQEHHQHHQATRATNAGSH